MLYLNIANKTIKKQLKFVNDKFQLCKFVL